ncbi:MAG: sugar phosphate isomerase/epimerase [Verrucomicrobiales bacterium]|nr:sugar phosphate isomerase/epimerase [Verrucomicrobiales bacterium]
MISRRSWLGTTAAGLAGLACETGLAKSIPPPLTCGVAIGTYGLQSKPLPEALQFISDTGFDATEITVFKGMTGEPSALGKKARKEIRKLLDGEKLRLTALMAHVQPSKDDAKQAAATDELKRDIELARDLNPVAPPLIQTVLGGGKDWDAAKEMFRDRLANWMQICADQKVLFCVKPHRGSALSRPEHAVWLLEQLGESDWMRICYDYSHFAFREPSMTIAETVKTALPLTAYVAVKDTVQLDGGKTTFKLVGEGGNWDTSEIVKAFHKGGYRGDFCCEVSSAIWRGEPNYDAEAATKLCYENLTAAFEKAGVPRG